MSGKRLVIYVDVDETLVRNASTKQIPIPAVVGHIRALNAEGAVLYCWSSGGGEYAESIARRLGVENCFKGFLPKPEVLVDDQPVDEWRRLVQVHPNQCEGKSVDDYLTLLVQGETKF